MPFGTGGKPKRSASRREFSRAQKVAMIMRALTGAGRILCEVRGLNITGKAHEFDHIIPGCVLERDCCHRGPGGKTATDLADIAEAKRREAKHSGVRSRPRLTGRGFALSEPQRSASRPLSKPAAWRRED
ncbi:hypothetical protein [Bosea rubneri]|uniref:HNH endonuclease n=1 Tax=Bosea rubneri TaxID=3075434 RepID=A0ABU3SGS4_9HYPH|nr:hypothetical protein [Bosea sp. ZW T0_25]MDU0343590.1 hypothetical protein [Bosea sp. ZW T0_25]